MRLVKIKKQLRVYHDITIYNTAETTISARIVGLFRLEDKKLSAAYDEDDKERKLLYLFIEDDIPVGFMTVKKRSSGLYKINRLKHFLRDGEDKAKFNFKEKSIIKGKLCLIFERVEYAKS